MAHPNKALTVRKNSIDLDILDRAEFTPMIPDPTNVDRLIAPDGSRWRRPNENQKAFVHALLEGNYMHVAAKQAGYVINASSQQQYVNAARRLLRQNPVVANYYLECTAERRKRSTITKEDHLTQLAILRDGAVEDRKWSAAISAEVARGRVGGHYVQKVEVEHTEAEHSAQDILKALNDKFDALLEGQREKEINVVAEVPVPPIEKAPVNEGPLPIFREAEEVEIRIEDL